MSGPVLVVDDEANVAAALRRRLHAAGLEVLLADGGPRALEILSEHDVAVIITDQRMPEMSGDKLLAEALRLRPDAYRIVVTGYADLASLQAAINEGHAQHLLFKPWDDEHLLRVVREGLRRFELIRENRRLNELTRQQKAALEDQNRALACQVQQRTAELEAQNRDLRRLQQQLTESLYDIVNVLSALIEVAEPNLALHSKRVAQHARRVGELLRLDEQALRDLEFAARLHEIGKAGRQAEPVGPRRGRGPGRRRPERRHAELGYAILSHVRGFEAVAEAVRHQHERYDGSGLPDGLRGEDIPLAARIIAVADAYDRGVYALGREARLSFELGRRAVVEGRGTAFDPLIVRTLLQGLEALGGSDAADDEIELPPEELTAGMVLSRDLRNMRGVLVLRAGTRLSSEHLRRVRALAAADPLVGGVFVRCTAELRPPADREAAAAPEAQRQSSRPDQTAGLAGAASVARRGRILVVDDDDLVRRALVRELRSAGWEVVCARDGRGAQNILEENRFDALVVDVAMPVMSGVALVAHVQQCWPDLPCVILTGHVTREQFERLRQLSVVAAILAKPWERQRLLDAIAAAVRQRPQPAPVPEA